METIVRAIDVGFGNTKYVAACADGEIHCASFPSIAYPSLRDLSTGPAAERRKTVAVPINGLFYEVGPEVHLAADTFRATQLHDRYTETPEYAALARGALSLMKVDTIDLLVVGLPVATLTAKKAALEKAMTGKHEVGGGRTVTVRKALAIAQPQGALVYYATAHQKLETIENELSLIIDPGARTFDWLVARGMRFVQKKSHSLNRGMFDVLQAIATEISEDIGTQYRDFDAIDTRASHRQESGDLPEALRHLTPEADCARHCRAGRLIHDAMDRGLVQLSQHHPGGRWHVSFQEGRQGGVPEAHDSRGEGSDVRKRQRISDRRHQLCRPRSRQGEARCGCFRHCGDARMSDGNSVPIRTDPACLRSGAGGEPASLR